MKKIIVFVLALFLMINVVNAEGKVKVYMFEAGGCLYCEQEEAFLKKLDGYNKTFELIKKELYVDHVDWKQGKDYELGKKVAEAFNKAGFEDASYEGTPFVVISDVYAAAAYSEDLESFIKLAYEEGDKDAVSCIMNNGTDCIRANSQAPSTDSKAASSKAGLVIAIIGGVALVGVAVYVITKKGNDIEETVVEEKEEVKEEKPAPVRKTTTRKTTTRKTTKKETK